MGGVFRAEKRQAFGAARCQQLSVRLSKRPIEAGLGPATVLMTSKWMLPQRLYARSAIGNRPGMMRKHCQQAPQSRQFERIAVLSLLPIGRSLPS
jgi:hypothetical protein